MPVVDLELLLLAPPSACCLPDNVERLSNKSAIHQPGVLPIRAVGLGNRNQ